MTDEWQLTRDDDQYETVAMAAKRLGYELPSMTRIFERAHLQPDGYLNARTPVYLVTSVDAMMAARPGRGRRAAPSKDA